MKCFKNYAVRFLIINYAIHFCLTLALPTADTVLYQEVPLQGDGHNIKASESLYLYVATSFTLSLSHYFPLCIVSLFCHVIGSVHAA